MGGRAGRRSAALAARWADEYNTIFAPPDECRRRQAVVAEAWERVGRDPDGLVFSLMTGCIVGSDRTEVDERRDRAMGWRGGPTERDEWLARATDGWVIGTLDEAAEHLRQLEVAGVQRVMLQIQDHGDVAMVDALGRIAAEVT